MSGSRESGQKHNSSFAFCLLVSVSLLAASGLYAALCLRSNDALLSSSFRRALQRTVCEGDECAAQSVLFSLTGCPCVEHSCQKILNLNIPGLERYCTVRQEDCDKGPCKCLGPTLGQYYDACVEGCNEQVFTNGGCRCIDQCRKRSSDDKPTCRIHPKEECADQSESGFYTLPASCAP
ncbi:unnamed protein product [Vitrella brassicaformis CCMP3155]|uniref:Uncharacterized protein n=1 Tax=Vitrella brassicaformis (strain CCMP3155) TaxID=1169540 RepID=A0A0G4E9C0_VITBC|nr:unnamed protein product [Vitrella brassicaformis CCMP3155]|mmetsp:Transcript_1237/g.3193  ORF Transcript_1237/g.3193 Transcript_1237/m.3193 type:complete len:179 (+) Transcript_1237:29-565(+)|eukprot:CEL91824.1 unnamed protein product [Vitrella brassicaformis CCMP3155]